MPNASNVLLLITQVAFEELGGYLNTPAITIAILCRTLQPWIRWLPVSGTGSQPNRSAHCLSECISPVWLPWLLNQAMILLVGLFGHD